MPEHKKPLIRYHVIDRCIRNTARRYSFDDLLEEVNNDLQFRGLEPVGKTTFYQDIKDMRLEFRAPIETYWYDRKKYYRYSDEDYSFRNQPLNQGEIDHLRDSAMILNRFAGIPGFEWIEELVSKLELGTFKDVNDPTVISFETNEFLKGREFIGPIFKAIVHKKVLDIRYQTFTADTERTHRLHPYHLKEYDSRWYLFGYYQRRDALLPLSVDRIIEVKEVENVAFIENKQFNFEEYFEDIIGIRRESAEPERIRLRFDPKMAPYVKTKPLHGSQKKIQENEDGYLEVEIEVIPNFELDALIFSFRDGVEVIESQGYRNHIRTLLEGTLGLYES